jgi:hypothetical protein
MSVFGFIENFFFISLALLFVLVVLLVYHFKTRITVAEKKSDSMYGLLTAVVKEIKTLRGMFGLGETAQKQISVSVPTREDDNEHVSCTPNNSAKSKIIPEVDGVIQDVSSNNQIEVITFEISAKEQDNKIVVSDYESESESEIDDTEYSGDDESDESDAEDDEDNNKQHQVNEQALDILPVEVLEFGDAAFQEFSLQNISAEPGSDDQFDLRDENDFFTPLHIEDSQLDTHKTMWLDENISNGDISPILIAENAEPEDTQESNEIVEIENISEQQEEITIESKDNVVDLNFVTPQIPSIENLKKMNIHQLRTIASQLGITTDITKMKKPELIALIREDKP